MARIWANRLEAGDQKWINVPEFRKEDIKLIMQQDVKNGIISSALYKDICGEEFNI